MSRNWTPRKKTVELNAAARPSRIRREPARQTAAELGKLQWWQTREWEIRLGIVGIVLFALAINALIFGVSKVTSN